MDDQTQHAANGSNESGPPRIEWGIVLAHGVLTVVLCRMSGQNLANEVAVRGVQVLTFPLGWCAVWCVRTIDSFNRTADWSISILIVCVGAVLFVLNSVLWEFVSARIAQWKSNRSRAN